MHGNGQANVTGTEAPLRAKVRAMTPPVMAAPSLQPRNRGASMLRREAVSHDFLVVLDKETEAQRADATCLRSVTQQDRKGCPVNHTMTSSPFCICGN